MKVKIYLLLATGLLILVTSCQNEDQEFELKNLIKNASFEQGDSGLGTLPNEWYNCGDLRFSPPDLFENGIENQFNVNAISTRGSKYVGMVVRSNGTRECIMQILDEPIGPGEYAIKITVSRSERYTGPDFFTVKEVEFNEPIVIEVFGVDSENNEDLLYYSAPIEETNWTTIQSTFSTNKSYERIKITPNFKPRLLRPDRLLAVESLSAMEKVLDLVQPNRFAYNGNVLIDEFELGSR